MPVKKTTTTTKAATKTAPRKKVVAKKTTTAAKTTTSRATKTSDPVAVNARHIEENARDIKNNSSMIHILYGTIIVLMMIIAGLAFYVGQMLGNKNAPTGNTNTPVITSSEDVTITIIDDARCADCQTDAITGQLKALPFLAGATFIEQDFSDSGVSDFITQQEITALPVVIFNTNALSDGGQIAPYLTNLPDGQFSLALGATFNPFAERSEKWFLILDQSDVESLKTDSPIDGNSEAGITWIEYSDLECPFCAKLHNEWTANSVKEKYGDDLNIIFKHFPLDFHANALSAAQALECANEQWADFYGLIDASFSKYNNNNFSLDGFYDLAVENWADKASLEACVTSEKYKEKALAQQTEGQSLFGITGTPGNVIINNATGEYEIVSGAYPASTFEAIVDRMLAK